MRSFVNIDFEKMPKRYRANFFNSIGGFKSLNLIATKGLNEISNVAPFNSIIHIGANPPYVGFIARPETEEHQTLKNIRETKQYTINNVTKNIYNQAHLASAKFDANTSEFSITGLNEMYTEFVTAPYVAESSIKLGLELESIIPIPLNGTSLVIGKVKEVIIQELFIEDDGHINIDAAGSITCAGLDTYFEVNKIARLPYASI